MPPRHTRHIAQLPLYIKIKNSINSTAKEKRVNRVKTFLTVDTTVVITFATVRLMNAITT